ncbi:MAG: lysoplasmalogenase, partial [Promethearchaeota archaeon]
FITKPPLVPLLILFYIFSIIPRLPNWAFILGLFFGFLGDVFLMLGREAKWFMYGLSSFLIGHIFYIITFGLSIFNILAFPWWGFLLIIPEILMVAVVLVKIKGKMGNLRIPTLVYVGVIFLMSFFAVLRLATYQIISFSFLLPWIGSLLFIISDGIIALDKFDKHIPHDRFLVMITYGLAQYLITQGIIISQILGI